MWLLLWERYNYGQIEEARGNKKKEVDWGWAKLLFSSRRILVDHLDSVQTAIRTNRFGCRIRELSLCF